MSQVVYANASYSRDAFSGVRSRRLFAWVVDAVIVGILTAVIFVLMLIGTLGLSWFVLPPLFPVIAVLYHAITVSGSGRGTLGMRAFDLEVSMNPTGVRAPFINAMAQAIFFYLSWALPFLFGITLIDGEKRFLHDILSSLVVTRRANRFS
jgi:uncharacterized RDD family membrane protein YckC